MSENELVGTKIENGKSIIIEIDYLFNFMILSLRAHLNIENCWIHWTCGPTIKWIMSVFSAKGKDQLL